jgi:hypothetical protein
MTSFAEILKKTEQSLKIIDNLKKSEINDIFSEYKIEEEIKKILEKKEINLGQLALEKIANIKLDKKEINYLNYSIAFEIDILESLIKNKTIRSEKQKKIKSFLIFEKLKEKIENIGKDKKNLYNFLDEYIMIILKDKDINLSDFNRRQLILRLCDRKSIKSEKYELSKNDLDKIKK